jgi:hypothetical protein
MSGKIGQNLQIKKFGIQLDLRWLVSYAGVKLSLMVVAGMTAPSLAFM